MARNKHVSRKKRLIKAAKRAVAAPFWALLRVFGKRRVYRWRLNQQERRSWRRTKLKL
ncbi:MAG: 50S ribosomal protein L39e [Candidatus Nanoarchaeia archaeon]|nr:50S ribosomal protein L39e [Candidatus Nanoarchaeia archaeon]MDD5239594.1 50S ribosomal protein L39e [Candidatus Nanoarchaeia archaeon]